MRVPIPAAVMTSTSPCVFCRILRGELPVRTVYEDPDHLAFLPLEHINPGHVLLIPRQHTDYLFDLSSDAYRRLWETAARLEPGIRQASGAKRVGVAVEGFHVAHAHVHLIPINAADELNPRRARALPADEAERLQKAIRGAIAGE